MNAPIISPLWFYLINVINNLTFTIGLLLFLGVIVLVALFIYYHTEVYDDEEKKQCANWIKTAIKYMMVGLVIFTFIPSEKTMYTILVAKNVTVENIEIATDVIQDGVDYIFEKLENK